ncbi:MAG: hypothetical protein V9G10_04445 [Candidatus Nanopelagicales bacterium]
MPSPDKSLVAFTSSGRLLVRNLATGLVTKLADGAQGRLSWSPDSTHIAFLSNAGLAIANVAAGDLVLVPGTAAAWSDDDHLVVSGRSSGIRIRTLSTGETRELVPSRYQVDAWRLAPDGRRLAFESSGDAVRSAIYVTDLATAKHDPDEQERQRRRLVTGQQQGGLQLDDRRLHQGPGVRCCEPGVQETLGS